MKAKPAAAAKPLSAVEEMLSKREALIADRDTVLSKLMELNAGIESLDTVIAMFDPNHVPLDIRRAQSAPLLTISAQPILAEVAKTVAAEETRQASTKAAAVKEAKPAAKEVKADTTKSGKPGPKTKKTAAKTTGRENVKVGSPRKADAAETAPVPSEGALAEAVSARANQKVDQKDQHQKKVTAAREQIRDYFGDIDKLKTLEDIVKSSSDGVPFRSICEAFAERHPIDITKPEVKKVFSDRLSALLHGLSQQNVVKRGERQGAEGKENVWLYTKNGEHASSAAAA
ncbi:hypothetical protein [Rhizobium sp. BK176]|uniref:hypothetical protein n=1 Tax=Rhizobium sp. BK176 TaxID=2587071 RepID=UPI00216A8F2F|nr:hypothetical protein [Rhizobium sp. BK176]MCS4089042.1 hypothetical protein [Rhizobium sp. BK176]